MTAVSCDYSEETNTGWSIASVRKAVSSRQAPGPIPQGEAPTSQSPCHALRGSSPRLRCGCLCELRYIAAADRIDRLVVHLLLRELSAAHKCPTVWCSARGGDRDRPPARQSNQSSRRPIPVAFPS